MWRTCTYMMLTDLEAVFRSLKGERGLRPILHSKVRKATRPEPDLLQIHDALGLAHRSGGVQKLIS